MNQNFIAASVGGSDKDNVAATHKDVPESERAAWFRGLLRRLGIVRNGEAPSTRGTLGDLIDVDDSREVVLDADEHLLVSNVLRVRTRAAEDAMIPRADIVAIDASASLADVIELMTRTGHSRIPVYQETLDDVIGMVHIKDVLAWRGRDEDFELAHILRRVLFIAPSMEILQLLLEMRAKRSHMALVVDEYGGIDGLITIEDVVEEIVGDISDEHEKQDEPEVTVRPDGALDADARAPVETLDSYFDPGLTEADREDIDTLGGLVVSLLGRVPIRGELIIHPQGLEFEVLDADPRRIKSLRVRRAAGPETADNPSAGDPPP